MATLLHRDLCDYFNAAALRQKLKNIFIKAIWKRFGKRFATPIDCKHFVVEACQRGSINMHKYAAV